MKNDNEKSHNVKLSHSTDRRIAADSIKHFSSCENYITSQFAIQPEKTKILRKRLYLFQ